MGLRNDARSQRPPRPWALGPMVVFDLETTGVDRENDRIVQAAVGRLDASSEPHKQMWQWIVNPGVPIPASATAVHGLTDAWVQAEGRPPTEAVDLIAGELALHHNRGAPIVGMNLAYDLTLLDRELHRYRLPSLEARLGRPVGPCVDVYVIDKWVDKYRKGSRKLDALLEVYGARTDGAHDAGNDALAAARVAYLMMRRASLDPRQLHDLYRKRKGAGEIVGKLKTLAALRIQELHERQVHWYSEQGGGLAAHWRGLAKEKYDLASLAEGAGKLDRRDELVAEAKDLEERAGGITREWPLFPRPVVAPITVLHEQESLL